MDTKNIKVTAVEINMESLVIRKIQLQARLEELTKYVIYTYDNTGRTGRARIQALKDELKELE